MGWTAPRPLLGSAHGEGGLRVDRDYVRENLAPARPRRGFPATHEDLLGFVRSRTDAVPDDCQ